jgi:hypothetical protein
MNNAKAVPAWNRTCDSTRRVIIVALAVVVHSRRVEIVMVVVMHIGRQKCTYERL